MNRLNFKTIILRFITLFFNFYLNSNNIEIIKNLSKSDLYFIDKNSKFLIGPKKMLTNSFNIPYVSIKNYISKFIKNTPYAPEGALRIEHEKNIFYLWKNELGVILVLDPNNPENLSKWKLNVIYLNKLKKSNLVLLVDQENNIKLVFK